MLRAWIDKLQIDPAGRRFYLAVMMCVFAVAYAFQPGQAAAPVEHAEKFQFFALFHDPTITMEQVCLMVVLGIAHRKPGLVTRPDADGPVQQRPTRAPRGCRRSPRPCARGSSAYPPPAVPQDRP